MHVEHDEAAVETHVGGVIEQPRQRAGDVALEPQRKALGQVAGGVRQHTCEIHQ